MTDDRSDKRIITASLMGGISWPAYPFAFTEACHGHRIRNVDTARWHKRRRKKLSDSYATREDTIRAYGHVLVAVPLLWLVDRIEKERETWRGRENKDVNAAPTLSHLCFSSFSDPDATGSAPFDRYHKMGFYSCWHSSYLAFAQCLCTFGVHSTWRICSLVNSKTAVQFAAEF